MSGVRIGISDLAKNVKGIYIGVNGEAKKVIKGLVGVNDVAKLFWGGGGTGYWFFFHTTATGFLDDYYYNYAQTITKYNNGIAFFGFVGAVSDGRGNYWYFPITLSPDEDATYIYAKRNGQDIPFSPQTDSLTYQGTTWYYTYDSMGYYLNHQAEYPADFSPNCYIDGIPYYDYEEETFDWEALIQDQLLSRIYCDDFAENYEKNHTYNAVWGNKEKTIRKAISIWIYKNYNFKGMSAYDTLLTNLETIINRLLTDIGNDDKVVVYFQQVTMTTTNSSVAVTVDSTNSPLDTFSPSGKYQSQGYTYLSASSRYLYTTKSSYAYITNTNISYRSREVRGDLKYVGAYVVVPSQYRPDYGVILSNLGLSL